MESKKHVLVVDDNSTNLKCTAAILQDTYKLTMLKSGEQAIDYLKGETADIILMDINMPDLDGYETMRRIKQNPDNADIPIIFLTSDSDRSSEIKGLQMGAMDFIRKPIEPEIMRSRIEKTIQIDEVKKKLTEAALKDVLTGLWNRSYLESQIDEYTKDPDNIGAFLLFDMDNFKGINDHLGHLIGDAVLVKFADTVREYISSDDIACRIGGDEFVIFLKNFESLSKVTEMVDELMVAIEKRISELTEVRCGVSVSVGIAMLPDDAVDFTGLYNKADKALYHVKQNGKNGYYCYGEKEDSFIDRKQKNGIADLLRIKAIIEEKENSNGAYQVEYSGFKHIYQFVSRCIGRTKQKVQIILFTLDFRDDYPENSVLLSQMQQLEMSIVISLRRGDVATQFSSAQFIAILMDASSKNGKRVADRIMESWGEIGEHPYCTLSYDIQEIEAEVTIRNKSDSKTDESNK